MKDTHISLRKADHININLKKDVSSAISTGLERFRFSHNALPEIDYTEIDTTVRFLGRNLKLPLLISSMTGGTAEAISINNHLALTAKKYGIAMGVGSQRAAFGSQTEDAGFDIRKLNSDGCVFANLGAVQLNYGFSLDECRRAVDQIHADGLILHLNAVQEALQPEGDTNFSNLLTKIGVICRGIDVPVIVKEVGWGILGSTARQLIDAGVQSIDVAGAGGTSWSQVEMYRIKDPIKKSAAASFRDWGIPTADSLRDVRGSIPGVPLIASGGLKTGVDAAKCLALGATICGMAGTFLKAAAISQAAVEQLVLTWEQELRVVMFATGSKTILNLQQAQLVETK